jgi:hypothetical protein
VSKTLYQNNARTWFYLVEKQHLKVRFRCCSIINSNAEVVTAFEIFEHLLSPFTVLQNIKANKPRASKILK